jgi:glycosyltransferase involved in cell wall biosynthesis
VIAALRDLGWDVRALSLGDGFPYPSPDQLRHAEDVLSDIPPRAAILLDGLAFGVLDDWARRYHDRWRLFALVHHPLALETGLAPDRQAELARRERDALAHTRGVLVTSHATARELVENYGVCEDRIVVAQPGVDPGPLATGQGDPPHILSVGSLTHRKGHDVLITALAMLRDLPWTCRIVGSRTLDPKVAAELEAWIEGAALQERIVLTGEVEDPRKEFARADIFALASRYEGYGMVFAEALAHGLPVVGCAAGAVPEVVPPAAGLLVEPDDATSFAQALRRLLDEPDTRLAMADAAAVAGAALPSWRETATSIATFLEARE